MDKNQILIDLSESDKTKLGKEDFATQSVPQKVFSAIWSVEAEVNNGGFSQYFFNSSTETAAFVVQALETIGAPKTGDICQRAINAAYPGGLPESADEISAKAVDLPEDVLESLDALDKEFFAYPHGLTELLFLYVVQHPEEFGNLPKPDDQ